MSAAIVAKALAAGALWTWFDSYIGNSGNVRWGEFIEGDVRDAAALDAVFAGHRFDAVMHFAALAYVGGNGSAHLRSLLRCNIAQGHGVLLDAMVRAGVGAIVFSSSCAV